MKPAAKPRSRTTPSGAVRTAGSAPRTGAASRHAPREFQTTALVLQGGGALGSYQAGVVEGLMEKGIEPDWVAGISIGAINSAIVAGNAPANRLAQLRGFWDTICQPATPVLSADMLRHWIDLGGDAARRAFSGFEAWRTAIEGKQGFFTPRRDGAAWLALPQPTAHASYYDTSALKSTLERFVDFDRINHGAMRLSVSAVDVQSGNFVYFDNREGEAQGRIRPEHIMASGALPPGFPAIEIEGRWYWDGGIVSNTPLWQVLEGRRDRDTLVFQVDLWSATGSLPTNVLEAQERLKDIQYSSRTRAVTDSMNRQQKNRNLIRELLDLIPPEKRRGNPWCERAEQLMCTGHTAVIQLIYREKSWEGHAKDYEFSQLTMLDHWAAGVDDARRALSHPEWLRPDPHSVFVTHDDSGL